jgi:hypothetical protein
MTSFPGAKYERLPRMTDAKSVYNIQGALRLHCAERQQAINRDVANVLLAGILPVPSKSHNNYWTNRPGDVMSLLTQIGHSDYQSGQQ